MRSLLPFILLLACPVMMVIMMRRMHGGGHESSNAQHDTYPSRDEAGTADGQESEARIAQLEREVAQLRAVRGEHSEHRWSQRV
jgi:uncharacterized protein YceH (UPF0502 family)